MAYKREKSRGRAEESMLLIAELYRAANGDQWALNQLLATLRAIIERFLNRRAGTHPAMQALVQDWTQEALIRVSGGIMSAEFENDRALVGWCLTVARNTAVSEMRKNAARVAATVLIAELEQLPDDDVAPPLGDRKAARAAVNRILDSLDADTHELIWRRLVEQQNWVEIAHARGCSAAAAKRRWQRLQDRIRSEAGAILCGGRWSAT